MLVSEHDPRLFTGRLADELDPTGSAPAGRVLAAVRTASAEDVLEALPDGLATGSPSGERSFSGRQRQRLVLARATGRRPEILVLVEPTSAVDAHTEARIADRLVTARRGRTVVYQPPAAGPGRRSGAGGRRPGRGRGTHRELLEAEPRYRAVVTRGEES